MSMDTTQQLSAHDVATYIIAHFYESDKEIDDGVAEGVTNLKLQKLLCFCQAFSLVRLGRPLFQEEIHAWKYGPVVPDIYRKYREYGNNPIPPEEKVSIGADNEKVVNEVLKLFGEYSAIRLMHITHSHKPWKDEERRVLNGEKNIVITKESIKKYYTEILV